MHIDKEHNQIGFTEQEFTKIILAAIGDEHADYYRDLKLAPHSIWVWHCFNSGPRITDDVRNNPIRVPFRHNCEISDER